MPAATPSNRFDALDALRGVAMVWMTVFHFSFDLSYLGYTRQNFYADPVWTWQRTCILSLFLLCAGMGQGVAFVQGQTPARFWRRWLQIAGCAVLVSIGSYAMFPQSFIYFGVLHGMAVMLLIARATAPWGRWLWLAGLVVLGAAYALPPLLQTLGLADAFNVPWLNWLGLVTRKPVTEDYVPVLPWLAVVWWGVAIGVWLQRQPGTWTAWRAQGSAARGLRCLGCWSLPYYMLHQPLMLGVLSLWGWAGS